MSDEFDVIAFATVPELWEWIAQHHARHPGTWVRLEKASSDRPSVAFHDLLEAGIAYGWSESTRRAYDRTSYLQKFTPRRQGGTSSARNVVIAERLMAEGRMTEAGLHALGW
ncbi:MAG: hypothetical protein Q4P07_02875 [Ornithinimicrobium sp.]|uniref:YdeI/OmpD-associated family protein n=1 Tax=Ornithinimicrobium sp. TaxID=1977084 RepID=UPI0026E07336|nr:hypothetical protein [Ornithinimicrobium sp.]MDO5739071.1 hypothetical protein [Ornithinimicrobium sp.]